VQIDIRKENVVEAEVWPSIEMQVMAKAQWKVMEIERCESKVVMQRRCEILARVTLLEKSINISNPEWFMWTQTKQNNDRHVERMENWKDIVEEEY
jgi:hypothetical protein